MVLSENWPLKTLNSFGVEAQARWFCKARNETEIREALEHKTRLSIPLFILGGGTNLLFTKDIHALVLQVEMEGMEVIREGEGKALVRVNAGTGWDTFVAWCVSHGWSGVENLSMIPGNTGSGPIQNIGAYGAEIAEVIREVSFISMESGRSEVLQKEDCRFGYRDSIFKSELAGRVIITSVLFELQTGHPDLLLDYGSIRQELAGKGIRNPGVADVREAVIRIRRSKLPDPEVLGNAGSFFKNPVVPEVKAQELLSANPTMPSWPDPLGKKIPAAWLIEQCGWKGKRAGQAGVHENQPLILVNYGGATGKEILALAGEIRASVEERFGLILETEVNII